MPTPNGGKAMRDDAAPLSRSASPWSPCRRAFNRLAHQLAKRLGKRLRYVDPGFTRAHLELRAELFEAIGIRER